MKIEWRYDPETVNRFPSWDLYIDDEFVGGVMVRESVYTVYISRIKGEYPYKYSQQAGSYKGLLTAQTLLLERLGITTVLSSEESDHE